MFAFKSQFPNLKNKRKGENINNMSHLFLPQGSGYVFLICSSPISGFECTFETVRAMCRLKELHKLMHITVDMRKVKVDAWFIKKSCVLVKKKITRDQWPRSLEFNRLMHLTLGTACDSSSDGEDLGVKSKKNK